MIKAICFDMDGMVFIEPHYFTEELEVKYDIPLKDSLFSKDLAYGKCKKGEITLNDFLTPYYKKWKKYPKFKLSIKEAKKEWFDFTQINREVVDLAKKIKKAGMINAILTNNTRERIEYLDKKYNLSNIFIILGSYDVGELKPSPRFYKVFLNKVRLKPGEILIFDDKEETIQKLHQQGFKAEIYSGIEKFKGQLKEYNVNS